MQEFFRSVIESVFGLSQTLFDTAVTLYDSFATGLTLDSAIRMVIIYAFIIWAAFVIWVIKDITNRSTSILLQVFCILLVIALTPLFGLPIYLLIRPSSTLFERAYYADEYEEDDDRAGHACPKCSYIVEERFKYCPSCGFECVTECESCGERIREGRTPVKHCPYCGKSRSAKSADAPAVAAPASSSPFVKSVPVVTPEPLPPAVVPETAPVVDAVTEAPKPVAAEASTVEIFKFSKPESGASEKPEGA
jgi:RNA polymerase subunit RPABC4/transcription elongation factor Spt4